MDFRILGLKKGRTIFQSFNPKNPNSDNVAKSHKAIKPKSQFCLSGFLAFSTAHYLLHLLPYFIYNKT